MARINATPTGRANVPKMIPATSFLVVLALCAGGAAARAQDAGKYPDLSGQWIRVETGPPRYDYSRPPGPGQQEFLTDEYRAIHDASMADQAAGGQGLDLGTRCIPMGMPRQMSGFYPFEFSFAPGVIQVLFEYSSYTTRRIYVDGRNWPSDVEPTFAGYSIGRWVDEDNDGRFDVLEVETRDLRGPRILDASGTPAHADNQSVIKERIYLDKSSPDLLHDEMTMIDHAFTRPWPVMKTFRRKRDGIWTDNDCADNGHVAFGNDNYFVSGDGYLMPTKKNQPPPDLRYFKQTRK
jgi:hypothetical protein